MGYLSFQILFFLILAVLLGGIIGWYWRGSRFDTELKNLDHRWRTKLGEVEGERDRFVAELTQANETKVRLEAEAKRSLESHESSLQQLKRDHQTKIAAFADMEKLKTSLQSDLAAREEELGKMQAEFARVQQTGSGDAGRLGKELAAASERAATLESSLKEAKTSNATCRNEVDRLKAEIAELKRAGSGGIAGATSSSGGHATGGGALGLVGGTGGGVSSTTGAGTGAGASGTGAGGTSTSGGASGSGGSQGGAGGGISSATGAGTGAGGAVSGSASGRGTASLGVVGGTGTSSSGSGGGAGASGSGSASGTGGAGQSGRPDSSYTQRAASPSYLADTGGQGFDSGGTEMTGGGAASSGGAGDDAGVQPAALTAARGGRADDLKRISGVGPKLEKTLNGLGIFHFSQIAEFTPDNVAWVDRHLRFKGRIERENWIEQSKILAAGGETEFSKRK